MKKKIKMDAVSHWVPRDRDEVNSAIDEIGRLHRERVRIETEMNDRKAEIKATHEALAKPIGERISELKKGVHLYCEANRATLTHGGKVKFHEFSSGVVNWRYTSWSVSISRIADVIDKLKSSRLGKYIRVREEIDKNALLADREAVDGKIDGIKFGQREEFSITPHESRIEEVQS